MVYVIIGVILLVIIVPIFSVLPNARQRQQMAMRNLARSSGVSVELTQIDDPNPHQDKYISHIGKPIPPILNVAGWRLQRRRIGDWRQLPTVNWCLKKDLEGAWHWQTPVSPYISDELKAYLDAAVESLPEDVEQVEESDHNIVVYWHERVSGSEQVVLDFLKKCAELPLHNPPEEDDF